MSLVFGMHIMEGFLPITWAGIWAAVALPFLIMSVKRINKITRDNPKLMLIIAFAGAFTFVLSSLKLPSVTGSCSHPTGMGLGAILFGPQVMVLIGLIVLLFQALLLAHGGLTTLGANLFSMGVAGPLVSYGLYVLLKKAGLSRSWNVFLAASLGSIATYVITALQLALAYPDVSGGMYVSAIKFLSVFAVTQLPIAAAEGILTVITMNLLLTYSAEELKTLHHHDISKEG